MAKTTQHTARLYTDQGKGFDIHPTEHTVKQGEQIFAFQFEQAQPLNNIRFHPADTIAAIQLQRIEVTLKDGSTMSPNYGTNALPRHDSSFIFDTVTPTISIHSAGLEISAITFHVNYIAVDVDTYPLILENKKISLSQKEQGWSEQVGSIQSDVGAIESKIMSHQADSRQSVAPEYLEFYKGLVAVKDRITSEKEQRIEELNRVIREKEINAVTAQKEADIRNNYIEEKERLIEDLNKQIQEKDTKLAILESEVEQKKEIITEKDKRIEEYANLLRKEESELSSHKTLLEHKTHSVAELEREVNALNETMRIKEKTAIDTQSELNAKNDQLLKKTNALNEQTTTQSEFKKQIKELNRALKDSEKFTELNAKELDLQRKLLQEKTARIHELKMVLEERIENAEIIRKGIDLRDRVIREKNSQLLEQSSLMGNYRTQLRELDELYETIIYPQHKESEKTRKRILSLLGKDVELEEKRRNADALYAKVEAIEEEKVSYETRIKDLEQLLDHEEESSLQNTQSSGQFFDKLKDRIAGVFNKSSNGQHNENRQNGSADYNNGQTPNKPAVRYTVKPDIPPVALPTSQKANGTSASDEAEVAEPEPKKRRSTIENALGVSICIITENELEDLKKCVASVIEQTSYPNYQLLIHTNACKDGTPQYLKELARQHDFIHLSQSTDPEPVIQVYNNLTNTFSENDIVLLSNKVTVAEGWLTGLHKAVHSAEHYGIAGSAVLLPNRELREFGLTLDAAGQLVQVGASDKLDRHGELKETGFVSRDAMYIKRDTINRIGLLDRQFSMLNFSISDFCYTAKESNIQTVVTPNSTVRVETVGVLLPTDKKGKIDQKIDFNKFTEKHLGKMNGIDWGLADIKLTDIRKSLGKDFTDNKGKLLVNGTQTLPSTPHQPRVDAVESYETYAALYHQHIGVFRKREAVEQVLSKTYFSAFRLPGFSHLTGKTVNYLVDENRPLTINGVKSPDYRINLVCDATKTNSIMRATSLVMEQFVDKTGETCLMFNELSIPLHTYYKKQIKTLTACTYPEQDAEQKTMKGIGFENPAALSFADNQFDLFVASEILQLIPDYKKAFAEIYRCLKPGGAAILVVPFRIDQQENDVRATISESGSVKHLQSPMFYDDPALPHRQLLCFQEFGWGILEELRAAGFQEVHANLVWSICLGILGNNVVITARK